MCCWICCVYPYFPVKLFRHLSFTRGAKKKVYGLKKCFRIFSLNTRTHWPLIHLIANCVRSIYSSAFFSLRLFFFVHFFFFFGFPYCYCNNLKHSLDLERGYRTELELEVNIYSIFLRLLSHSLSLFRSQCVRFSGNFLMWRVQIPQRIQTVCSLNGVARFTPNASHCTNMKWLVEELYVFFVTPSLSPVLPLLLPLLLWLPPQYVCMIKI